MEYKDIEKLIEKLDKSNLTHFQYEEDNFKLIIKKEAAVKVQVKQTEAVKDIYEEKAEENKEDLDKDIYLVKSPIVGTFYSSSSPDIPAFAKVGDKVKKGDTLCIIEAMKLMNEIEAEADGEIAEVLADNEEMVEFGEVLFKIKQES